MPACALSFSRSLIDFPAVVDLTVVPEEDGVPRDMDHRSSNPDKPLADEGGAGPEAGALFGAAVDVRETGMDADMVGESGCDDDQRVFWAGVGDIVAANDWDCLLLLVTEESGFSAGALKTGGEVVLFWACDANVVLMVEAGGRFVGGEEFSISIRVGRVAGGEAGEDGEGAAWKSAKSSSIEMSACSASDSQGKGLTIESGQGRQCLVRVGVVGRRRGAHGRIIKATKQIDHWFLLLWSSRSRRGLRA